MLQFMQDDLLRRNVTTAVLDEPLRIKSQTFFGAKPAVDLAAKARPEFRRHHLRWNFSQFWINLEQIRVLEIIPQRSFDVERRRVQTFSHSRAEIGNLVFPV